MSTDMRNEFETYVKTLTTAICKEILLTKIEELYSKYEIQYQNYSIATKASIAANDLLQNKVQVLDRDIDIIQNNIKDSVDCVYDYIEILEEKTEGLFLDMKNLNIQNRDDFILALTSCIDEYKEDIARVFAEGCKNISDKLAGAVTPEIMQQFVDSLEQNTKEVKELAVFINETYKSQIEGNITSIIEKNRAACEEIDSSVSKFVKKIMNDIEGVCKEADKAIEEKTEDFSNVMNTTVNVFVQQLAQFLKDEKKSRDESIHKQIDLIEQIGTGNEKIAQLEEHVARLEILVKDMEHKSYVNNEQLQKTVNNFLQEQKEIEKRRNENMIEVEKGADKFSWRIYMFSSNILALCILGLMILFPKPWETLQVKYIGIFMIGVLGLGMILGTVLRSKIAKYILRKKETLQIKNYQQNI